MKGHDRKYRIYTIEESRPGYGVPLTTISFNDDAHEWETDNGTPLKNVFDREWLKDKIIEVSGPEELSGIFPRRILGDGFKDINDTWLKKVETLTKERGYDDLVSRIFAYWFANICQGYTEREEDYPAAAVRRKNRGKLKKYCENVSSCLNNAQFVYGADMKGIPLLPQAIPNTAEIIQGLDSKTLRAFGYACSELNSAANKVLEIIREIDSLDKVKIQNPWDGRADLVLTLAAAYHEILGELPKTTNPDFTSDGNLFYSLVIETYDVCLLLNYGSKKNPDPTKTIKNAVKTYNKHLHNLRNKL